MFNTMDMNMNLNMNMHSHLWLYWFSIGMYLQIYICDYTCTTHITPYLEFSLRYLYIIS